jgi:hypothetical protein
MPAGAVNEDPGAHVFDGNGHPARRRWKNSNARLISISARAGHLQTQLTALER